ncbi:death-inducer obliterator 1-like [Saccostrea cucullata]|uniref:death-inducer obliterator 1-like n=1 Tax=Saccostrea cuccullata TaxID=36930 RepID=UPI002ED4BA50
MKRSHDIKVRTSKFKVGDLVYWRRNAGKKVESVWRGPGIIIETKSDTIFVVKSRREVKVMHHDKLKRCESRQLPKWLVNYKNKLPGQSVARDGDCSLVPEVVAPLGSADSGLSPGSPGSGGHSIVSPKPAESVGPYMSTRKRVKERLDQTKQPQSPKRPRATRGTKTKKYCVCLQSNPKGMMVQCDNCRDWFHPWCVGISEDYAKSVPQYICPE